MLNRRHVRVNIVRAHSRLEMCSVRLQHRADAVQLLLLGYAVMDCPHLVVHALAESVHPNSFPLRPGWLVSLQPSLAPSWHTHCYM